VDARVAAFHKGGPAHRRSCEGAQQRPRCGHSACCGRIRTVFRRPRRRTGARRPGGPDVGGRGLFSAACCGGGDPQARARPSHVPRQRLPRARAPPAAGVAQPLTTAAPQACFLGWMAAALWFAAARYVRCRKNCVTCVAGKNSDTLATYFAGLCLQQRALCSPSLLATGVSRGQCCCWEEYRSCRC
jgi:hypothetical protein